VKKIRIKRKKIQQKLVFSEKTKYKNYSFVIVLIKKIVKSIILSCL